jgi:hypothetical protein
VEGKVGGRWSEVMGSGMGFLGRTLWFGGWILIMINKKRKIFEKIDFKL